VRQGGQIDPDAAAGPARCRDTRQARLADTRGAHQGDAARAAQQRFEPGQIGIPPDQAAGALLRCRRRARCRLRHRLGGIRQRCHEAVAAPGHGGDRIATQHLAQVADLHLQIGFFHHQVGPHAVEQLALGEQMIGLPRQRHQQIERAPAERGDLAVDQQAPFGRLQLEATRSTEVQPRCQAVRAL
jgi:hypothetical protein